MQNGWIQNVNLMNSVIIANNISDIHVEIILVEEITCNVHVVEKWQRGFLFLRNATWDGNTLFVSLVEETKQIIFIATIKHSLLNEVIQQG